MSSLNTGGATPAPTALPLNLASFARMLLVAMGAGLVQHGYLSSDQLSQVAGAVVVVAAVIWTFIKNHRVKTALTAALTSPAVPLQPGGPKMTGLGAVLLMIGLVCLVAPSLTACATGPLIPPSAAVAVAQGETTLDLAYNLAAKAYLRQLPTMSAATKAKVKPILVKAYQLVQTADAAETLGSSTTVASQIAEATQLLAQAKSLLGVH